MVMSVALDTRSQRIMSWKGTDDDICSLTEHVRV